MKFMGAVWKLLVGIKDGLVLVFMMMFFALLYVTLSARPQPIGTGVLDVSLNGTVVEQPERQGWADAAGGVPDAPVRSAQGSSPPSTAPGMTTGSRRSRSISTASPAAARAR